jgi:hypothetical protein
MIWDTQNYSEATARHIAKMKLKELKELKAAEDGGYARRYKVVKIAIVQV